MINIWVFLGVLIIATYTDIKSKTIPIGLFPIIGIVCLLINISCDNFGYENIIAGFIMFLIFILATFLGGGGADVIMYSILGLTFGITTSIWITIISLLIYSLYTIIFCLLKKKSIKTTTLALAPATLFGYIIYFVIL